MITLPNQYLKATFIILIVAGITMCQGCGADKASGESLDILPGDWVCRGCTANNFAKRQTCFKCGSKRRVSSFTNCTVILYTIYSVTISITVQF